MTGKNKIQYCSDLHLEFPGNEAFLRENPIEPVADALILAGDIVPLGKINEYKWFLSGLEKKFEKVWWIPGNHEYYGNDLTRRMGSFCEKIRKNIYLLNNQTVTYNGIKLIFSTLWSKISPVGEFYVEKRMADFSQIRYGRYRFSSRPYNELHQECLSFLKNEMSGGKAEKTVVITHHVPTLKNYPEEYNDSLLSEGFAVELFPFIQSSGADYWIYGHHHRNVPEFTIGKTRMVTNQMGYVDYGEHLAFDPERIIEF